MNRIGMLHFQHKLLAYVIELYASKIFVFRHIHLAKQYCYWIIIGLILALVRRQRRWPNAKVMGATV